MNVLHLTTHLNVGGITTYILRLIKPLRNLGDQTFVLSSGGKCVPELEERGAKTFKLPIRTKSELNPILYLSIPAVKKIIRDHKIDLLHAHTRVTQVMAYWIQKSIGIPVVTTCHGFYKNRLGRRILPAWGDRVIAISQGVADHLRDDFKVSPTKIRVVNNGVDLDEIDPAYKVHDPEQAKLKYGFSKNDLVIGIVAQLVADKGHEYLIQAIHILQKEFPSIRLLIVGDGNQKKNLQKLVAELKLEKRVILTGNISDVTHPLAATDIFALPATWREGFGLSIVEAMACHKPVIVSNIWALNALIENKVTGILIEPRQVETLAHAISQLVKNPALQREIGTNARKMVEDFFSITRMAKEVHEVYLEITGKP